MTTIDRTALRTSEAWMETFRAEFPGCVLMDPDGWDRANWDFSWHQETISWDEFMKRFQRSTIQLDQAGMEKLREMDQAAA